VKLSFAKTSQQQNRYDQTFKHLFSEYPNHFQESNHSQADALITFINHYDQLYEIDTEDRKRTVVFLTVGGELRPLMNSGKFVDDPAILGKYNIKKILDECLLVFTSLDFNPALHNYCLTPFSFNNHSNVNQDKDYWRKDLEVVERKNQVFWSGSTWTHKSRGIIETFNKFGDSRYALKGWWPKTSSGEKASVYGKNKPNPKEYTNYIKRLSESDATLVVRGDRPWVFSFLDVLRSNTIPIFIDTGYPNLGWESLNYDFSAIGLAFDSSKSSPESMKINIDNLLNNPPRIKSMRKVIKNFYDSFIKQDLLYKKNVYDPYFCGWMDFYAAKLIQVFENIDSDKRFFSKSIWSLRQNQANS
jgi:hypothetical protein